jgi:tripartite-type tricarboxylate transporter receptor subunit TctC
MTRTALRDGFCKIAWALGLLVLGATAAGAQDAYPSKPIRIVVPFPAGSGPDVLARVLAPDLQEQLGQPVVADNRTGAGGIVGSEVVAKAPPDGYTLLLGTVGTHAFNLALYSKLPYHPVKDFVPITQVAQMPHVAVVSPAIPARSMMEFVDYARARPGALNVASAGVGTSMHLAYELMRSVTHIDMVHVPYRGPSETVMAVVQGDVALAIPVASAALPMVTAGRVRALAVTSPQRMAQLADVPTMAEAGFPRSGVTTWYGLFAPARTPAPIVQKLNQAVVRVLHKPHVVKALAQQGAVVIANTPEQFATTLDAEIVTWGKVVKDANVRVE